MKILCRKECKNSTSQIQSGFITLDSAGAGIHSFFFSYGLQVAYRYNSTRLHPSFHLELQSMSNQCHVKNLGNKHKVYLEEKPCLFIKLDYICISYQIIIDIDLVKGFNLLSYFRCIVRCHVKLESITLSATIPRSTSRLTTHAI